MVVRRTSSAPLPALLALVCASSLAAHGGQYRGGWNTPPVPGKGIPGATGGVPVPGGGAAPLTGGRPTITDGTSWQVWWEFSKDPLLLHTGGGGRVPVTGSDDFYLGSTRRPLVSPPPAALEPDDRERIAVALVAALEASDNRDITTAAMIALAKLGHGPQASSLRNLLSARLSDRNQEVHETAALAIGIAGNRDGIDVLVDVLADNAAGRRLCRGSVDDRTRTFAAWGLGLLGQRTPKLEDKRRVRDALLQQLQARATHSRDLRVGLIEGLGLIGDLQTGEAKLLSWRTAAELWRYFDRDLGKGDQLVQAHVPIAIARLLGRGDSSEHRLTKQRLLDALTTSERVHQSIRQSAAMALGSLCVEPEQQPDEAPICDALRDYYREGTDQLTRHFCVLALGRIGGARNRATLLQLWPKANRNIERPWIALALGLIARERRAADGQVDEQVGRLLLDELVDSNADDARSALVLAIGLTGYEQADVHMLPLLDEGGRRWMLCGYACIGLSLLESRPSTDRMLELIDEQRWQTFIVQQASLGLARLRDPRVVPELHERLSKSDSTAELATIANALSLVGDRTSIEPLIEALQDRERPKLARAFAAAALGGIGDKDALPWNTRIAVGMNYMATVDTLTNGQTGILDIL